MRFASTLRCFDATPPPPNLRDPSVKVPLWESTQTLAKSKIKILPEHARRHVRYEGETPSEGIGVSAPDYWSTNPCRGTGDPDTEPVETEPEHWPFPRRLAR